MYRQQLKIKYIKKYERTICLTVKDGGRDENEHCRIKSRHG